MKISESKLKEIVRETIEEVAFGDTRPLMPYTKQEKEQNFKGIGRMGNPSYDAFKAWRENGLKQGIPSIQLSWNNYIKQKDM